ncbi:glycosyltransferase family 2 protein [Naumannella halotolerans]|uniref:glycosyltransferase family 2 protein n=1 Tax=Naumannella halotolerans TaxID=993414 RepID=UPI00370D786C
MSHTTLTIGITTYERPDSLSRAVESIVTQCGHGDRVELIIVDDASKSEKAVHRLRQLDQQSTELPIPLHVIRHDSGSGGPSAGRNDIISNANGDYVLFLDDDNLVAPGSLRELAIYLATSTADWVSLRRSRHGRDIFKSPPAQQENITRKEALYTFIAAGCFRVSALHEHGVRFNPDVSYGEDTEFVLDFAVNASAFSALSDRCYIIEEDPFSGELPHISHGPRGIDQIRKLTAHVGRLGTIVERSTLPVEEKILLGETVLMRTLVSYQLARKIAGIKDDEEAKRFLGKWRHTILRTMPSEHAVLTAESRNMGAVVQAIIATDTSLLRMATAAT